jgi:hypothetical protein
MPMNLYRRHRPDCEGGHPFDSRSGEFEERKKTWRRCACYIFVSGTLDGQYKRKYTGASDWNEAKTIAAQWELAGRWDGPFIAPTEEPPRPTPTPDEPKIENSRTTIADAITLFLTNREGMNITPPTLRKYRTFARQIAALAESKGYVMLDQVTPADIDLYYSKSTVVLKNSYYR